MMGQSVYLKNVVTLNLDQEKCVACGLCLLVCPHAVLSLTNGHIEIANRDACMECGACAKNCPTEALSVRSGVGCATAVMNSVLGRKNSACCCTIDPEEKAREISEGSPNTKPKACC